MPVATSPVTTMGFELVSSLQLERFQSAVMLPGRAIYTFKGSENRPADGLYGGTGTIGTL